MFIRRSLQCSLRNSFSFRSSIVSSINKPSPITSLQRLFHTIPSGPLSFSATSASASASASSSPVTHGAHSASAVAPVKSVRGMLTVDELRHKVHSGEIETVIVGFCDMYGRLMGKRFDGEFFLESALKGGTHACDYLLASDMEMQPINGFEFANWERGFGDFHLVPDMNSLRIVSWQPKTAMVLCDIFSDKTHQYVPVAPRSVLRHQLSEAAKLGKYRILAASELEYYMFEKTYREAKKLNYQQSSLVPVSDYFEDYHMLQTAREEKYTREFRKHLMASGIPVENSKGECGLGQHELNVKYSTILDMSDRHLVYKQCLKEIADQMGVSVTFMAKPFTDFTGSGCHIHLSLNDENGKNLFAGTEDIGPVKGSKLFKHFLAGWLKYTNDCMVFYAPTINSYKRFVSSSWAPTKIAWSFDNRTAGYRVVGSGQSLRIECRIPGADANPYLAFAASLASGLAGIKEELIPPPLFEGNIYDAQSLPSVPKSLAEAADVFEKSAFAKKAFGESVVKHYAHFFKAEVDAYNKNVMDWERTRYFERI